MIVQPIVPHCTSDEKCSNDGKCEITDDESFCKCSKDYFGPFCEMKSCSGSSWISFYRLADDSNYMDHNLWLWIITYGNYMVHKLWTISFESTFTRWDLQFQWKLHIRGIVRVEQVDNFGCWWQIEPFFRIGSFFRIWF